jgi:3-oxoacyl-[acyl-carrier protein] reductase
MIPHGSGVIVNIASGLSFRGDAFGVHYAATKHAIRGLTKSLALALGPRGIRVNAVAPGPTLTRQALQARSREDLIARGRQLPLGRIGQPADIAGAVSFLLSDDAAYMTGQTILVNGGADMP